MNKKEFMKELKEHLVGLSDEDVKEILDDYEEHFKVGKKKKRKESEIAESLGNPKEIAREARKELRNSKERSFEEDSIELWVKIKRVIERLWRGLKKGLTIFVSRMREIYEGRIDKNKKKSSVKKKESKKSPEKEKAKRKKGNFWKGFSLMVFNFLIAIWIWIALFSVIISLIVTGWAIVFSGIISLIALPFGFAVPISLSVRNLLISGMFASGGIAFLGLIFSTLSWQLGKIFFKGTKVYYNWNKKIVGGKNE